MDVYGDRGGIAAGARAPGPAQRPDDANCTSRVSSLGLLGRDRTENTADGRPGSLFIWTTGYMADAHFHHSMTAHGDRHREIDKLPERRQPAGVGKRTPSASIATAAVPRLKHDRSRQGMWRLLRCSMRHGQQRPVLSHLAMALAVWRWLAWPSWQLLLLQL